MAVNVAMIGVGVALMVTGVGGPVGAVAISAALGAIGGAAHAAIDGKSPRMILEQAAIGALVGAASGAAAGGIAKGLGESVNAITRGLAMGMAGGFVGGAAAAGFQSRGDIGEIMKGAASGMIAGAIGGAFAGMGNSTPNVGLQLAANMVGGAAAGYVGAYIQTGSPEAAAMAAVTGALAGAVAVGTRHAMKGVQEYAALVKQRIEERRYERELTKIQNIQENKKWIEEHLNKFNPEKNVILAQNKDKNVTQDIINQKNYEKDLKLLNLIKSNPDLPWNRSDYSKIDATLWEMYEITGYGTDRFLWILNPYKSTTIHPYGYYKHSHRLMYYNNK